MELIRALMTLIGWLWQPHRKPPANAELDARLDRVEDRLRILSPAAARRARRIVEQGR